MPLYVSQPHYTHIELLGNSLCCHNFHLNLNSISYAFTNPPSTVCMYNEIVCVHHAHFSKRLLYNYVPRYVAVLVCHKLVKQIHLDTMKVVHSV